MHLKDRLCDIETDCRNRLHRELLRIVGASNGAHSLARSCPWRSRPQHHKLTSAHPYSIKAVSLRLRLEREIFQFNHISNGARTTRLLNFNLISRAELSNGDVEASSASPE